MFVSNNILCWNSAISQNKTIKSTAYKVNKMITYVTDSGVLSTQSGLTVWDIMGESAKQQNIYGVQLDKLGKRIFWIIIHQQKGGHL